MEKLIQPTINSVIVANQQCQVKHSLIKDKKAFKRQQSLNHPPMKALILVIFSLIFWHSLSILGPIKMAHLLMKKSHEVSTGLPLALPYISFHVSKCTLLMFKDTRTCVNKTHIMAHIQRHDSCHIHSPKSDWRELAHLAASIQGNKMPHKGGLTKNSFKKNLQKLMYVPCHQLKVTCFIPYICLPPLKI